MYKVRLAISGSGYFKDLDKTATGEFRKRLQTQAKPAIQKQVTKELSVEPGPVKYPFVFHSDPIKNAKIRAAFFATNGFGRGLGAQRTHQLSTSWFVDIAYKLTIHLITVYNNKKYTKYVYPPVPYQIPGHIKTGWGKDFDKRYLRLESYADLQVALAWYDSIVHALENR